MTVSSQALSLQALADQLAALLATQAAELREYGRTAAAGEGTIQLERNLQSLERRRAALYGQLEDAMGSNSRADAKTYRIAG